MKNIKKIIYLSFLCWIPLLSYAQSDQYLEIRVTDTIMIQPEEIYYNINLMPHHNQQSTPAGHSDLAAKKKELEAILTSNNLDIQERGLQGNYIVANYPTTSLESIVVRLKSRTELEQLMKLLRSIENINGGISNLRYGKQEDMEAILLQRLIEKGKKKAAFLAKSMDMNIQEIIAFTEIEKGITSIMEEAIRENSSGGWTTFVDNQLEKSIEKTVILRFKVE